eukprot:TRINITY_DN3761_c0_g2_i2.p1 TRINITY_DN3761_c0_g2~~TRINITY_DN3761_c0_g2_i2.p1  ORF type:complete len:224 (+),score=-37.30 TRINITY_DN3761_c0_g2_i2:429-1100(+)
MPSIVVLMKFSFQASSKRQCFPSTSLLHSCFCSSQRPVSDVSSCLIISFECPLVCVLHKVSVASIRIGPAGSLQARFSHRVFPCLKSGKSCREQQKDHVARSMKHNHQMSPNLGVPSRDLEMCIWQKKQVYLDYQSTVTMSFCLRSTQEFPEIKVEDGSAYFSSAHCPPSPRLNVYQKDEFFQVFPVLLMHPSLDCPHPPRFRIAHCQIKFIVVHAIILGNFG